MLMRDWSDDEVKDLMGRNLMRVMDQVDAVAAQWGGDANMFYPTEVQEVQAKIIPQHDEL